MSSRKYRIEKMTQDELAELEKFNPRAVKTVRRPVYGVIAKLLDCGIEAPGIRLKGVANTGEDAAA